MYRVKRGRRRDGPPRPRRKPKRQRRAELESLAHDFPEIPCETLYVLYENVLWESDEVRKLLSTSTNAESTPPGLMSPDLAFLAEMFAEFPIEYVSDVLDGVEGDISKATAFLLEIEEAEHEDSEETPGELPLERIDSQSDAPINQLLYQTFDNLDSNEIDSILAEEPNELLAIQRMDSLTTHVQVIPENDPFLPPDQIAEYRSIS